VPCYLLFSAGADSTAGDAYLVTADTGEPVELPLTPRRPDGQVEYGSRRGQLLSQNISRVQNALANEAASDPVDLLARIAVAARITSVPGTLLIFSSGLSTTGAFDLRQVGWDANPAAIAAQLESRGLLPPLAGWRVIFSGLGDTAPPQPALPLPQRTALIGYWMAICHAAQAVSCGTDEMTRPAPPSHSTAAVPVVLSTAVDAPLAQAHRLREKAASLSQQVAARNREAHRLAVQAITEAEDRETAIER